uniref:Uncharacterized protein n=1 Tax=Vespula pensylvanica TaxID=30213 RepID=A0A834NIR5_VESPE|nr:hypothetical protein H0235_013534 [Vespula pensylvanica]
MESRNRARRDEEEVEGRLPVVVGNDDDYDDYDDNNNDDDDDDDENEKDEDEDEDEDEEEDEEVEKVEEEEEEKEEDKFCQTQERYSSWPFAKEFSSSLSLCAASYPADTVLCIDY